MLRFFPVFSFVLLSCFGYSQIVEDFTVTDYNDVEHTLYADYLDQGKTVVIKIFFVACPPCQAQAPFYESHYQEWGAGQHDVAFFEISDKTFDSNLAVENFADNFGTSMPGVGNDGGGPDAVEQFTSGTFGTFWGHPTYVVIAPNGTVAWDTGLAGLKAAITATGAMMPEPEPEPSTYQLSLKDTNGNTITLNSTSSVIMKSQSDPSYSLDITPYLQNGSFEYPTDDIPEIDSPTIVIEDIATANQKSSSLDLILIQKHLLGIQPFQTPYQILAADTNNNGSASAIDLIELQKCLLGIYSELPNNTLNKYYFPACQNCRELVLPLGVDMDFTIDIVQVVTGNVN